MRNSNPVEPRAAEPESAAASALRTIGIEARGLETLADLLRGELAAPFEAAIALLQGTGGRVVVTGVGKSGHIGRKIAATFASTGTPAHFVHASEAGHGDLGMITGEDIILALSWSGETTELRAIIDYSRRFRVPLVALTSKARSTLAQAADVALALPLAREACPHGLAPTTSTLMQLAVGDALAVALLEARGFTATDFRTFHPGGKLGAQLRHVSDVMHREGAVPLAPLGLEMSEALIRMSEKGFGCLGVVDGAGALVGVITDGDLRRRMRPDLLTLPVEEVMTGSPRTVAPETLAAEALDYMSRSKITALFVAVADRPVGIVHIHDFLRIGVA